MIAVCPQCGFTIDVPVLPFYCQCGGHTDIPTPEAFAEPIIPIGQQLDLQPFRDHWLEFHTQVRTIEEFYDWQERIPAGICACHEHWKQIVEANPPEPVFATNDPAIIFAWKVARHNDVNQSLGKSFVSVDEAIKLYRRMNNDQ